MNIDCPSSIVINPEKFFPMAESLKVEIPRATFSQKSLQPSCESQANEKLKEEYVVSFLKAFEEALKRYEIDFFKEMPARFVYGIERGSEADIGKWLRSSQLNDMQLASLRESTAILQELNSGNYDRQAALIYGSFACNILCNALNHPTLSSHAIALQFFKNVTKGMQEGSLVKDDAQFDQKKHKYSLLLRDAKTDKARVFLKLSGQPWEASHRRVIQEMKPFHVPTHEYLGTESDSLLGFSRSPIVLRVHCKMKNEQDEICGILRAYDPDANDISDFLYGKGGAKTLKDIPAADVQMTALSGLLLGRADGHIGNYLVSPHPLLKNTLLNIDNEESLPPFNRLPDEYHVRRKQIPDEGNTLFCEDLEQKREILKKELSEPLQENPKKEKLKELEELETRLVQERRSIVIGRLAILGLPQASMPFDRAALLCMSHPGIGYLINLHHDTIIKEKEILPSTSLEAQKERWESLQKRALEELQKKEITATPRDFYLELFGGKELCAFAIEKKGFVPFLVFNNLVSAYRYHNLTDLSNWQAIEPVTLDKPKQGKEILYENLRELYKQQH